MDSERYITMSCSGSNNQDNEEPRPAGPPPKASLKYDQKYNKLWEASPLYNRWLSPSENGNLYAFCKPCGCDILIKAGKTQLDKHAKSKKHKDSCKALPKQPTLHSLPAVQSCNVLATKVKNVEIRLEDPDIDQGSTTDYSDIENPTEDPLDSCDIKYQVKAKKMKLKKRKVLKKSPCKSIKQPKENTEESILKCQVCEFQCKNKSGLKLHVEKHTTPGVKRFECNICEKKCISAHNLNTHMTVHSDTRPHKCNNCDKSFKYKNEYMKHRIEHGDEKPFKCDLCPKSYLKNRTLRDHRETHLYRYKCKICDKVFALESSLIPHQLIHKGIADFRCEECALCFPTKQRLKIHSASHTAKKYYCEVCNKYFRSKSYVERHHGKIHVNKPKEEFYCNECGKFFESSGYLNIHTLITKHTK